MKKRHYLLLQFQPQVNHHVAAGDQVKPRKGRVLDETVARKKHLLPQRGFHLVTIGLFHKEPLQPLGTHFLRNAVRIAALTGRLQTPLIDIRGKDLYLRRVIDLLRLLTKQDGQRICLLTRRAPYHADSNLVVGVLPLKQLRNDLSRQHLKPFGIAKELRDTDQHVLKKTIAFFWLFFQHLYVIRNQFDL